MKIHVSLRTFWLSLIAFFSAFALLIWLWLIPYNYLEYNLGTNLFSNSIFMVLTIILFNVLLNQREKSEWKTVKDYVYRTIQDELGVLFFEILNYVENGLFIRTSLLRLQDKKIRNEKGLSELRKLKDTKELKLNAEEFVLLLEYKNQLEAFLSVSRNLGEVETKYSRFLPSELTLSLMKIRDSIRLIEAMVQLHRILKNLVPVLSTPMPKESQGIKDVIPTSISLSFKKLIEEIDNIHKIGIEFSFYPA